MKKINEKFGTLGCKKDDVASTNDLSSPIHISERLGPSIQ